MEAAASAALAAAGALLLAGCASTGPERVLPHSLYAVTAGNTLLSFNAGRPQTLLTRVAISGLQPGESVLGIDFRPANGQLYAATSLGHLYLVDRSSGTAARVGSGSFAAFVKGDELGFDFNPVVDRIRVVDNLGTNLRLHPDTGAVVDSNAKAPGVQIDVPIAYATEDPNEGKPARIVGAAYTHGTGAKATTNFAIDAAQAVLVTQGRREGTTPAKPPATPNSGLLFTVGPLGVDPGAHVGFDIDAKDGTAFASFTSGGEPFLFEIDLASGHARRIGLIGAGETVRGIAVAP